MVRVYLNNTEIAVNNLEELVTDFSFNPFQSPNASPIEQNIFEIPKTGDDQDGIVFIKNWIASNGVYNGIPCNIIDDSTGLNIYPSAFLDLSSENNSFDDDLYLVELKSKFTNFISQAQGLNLQSLYNNPSIASNEQIAGSDIKKIGYLLNGVPDFLQTIILSITAYLLTKEIIFSAREAAILIKDALNTGFDSGTAALRAAAQIVLAAAYVTATVLALKELLDQLSDSLFQKPKFYNASRVISLMTKGANALGYSFQSSIFDGDLSDLCIIPKIEQEGSRNSNTASNNPCPNLSYLDLVNIFSDVFNAKAKVLIDSNTIIFENEDFFKQSPIDYTIPDLDNKGNFKYNLFELPRSYELNFVTDPSDKNASDNNPIYRTVVNWSLNNVLDKTFAGLTRGIVKNIPLSFCNRKNRESNIEKFFNSLYDIWSEISGREDFGSRTGYLLLEAGQIGNDRLCLIGDDNRLLEKNNTDIISSKFYDDYHKSSAPYADQWLIYEGSDAWSTCEGGNINLLRENNVINNNGQLTVLETVKVNNDRNLINVPVYRVKSTYISRDKFNEQIL